MNIKPDSLQTQKIRMLDRFYGLFIWFCCVLLGIGVPFIFYRKVVSAVLIGLVIAGILLARRVSRRGSPERSLIHFSLGIWIVLTTLAYGGLPTNGAGIALATGVMLAVVVSNRAGIIFVSAYLLMLLGYISLQQYELAPDPYFASNPIVAWLLVVGAFLLTLIPIPELVRALNEGASRQRSVLEATSDAILVVDLSGGVDSYNQRFVEIWEIPNDLIDQRRDEQLLDYVLAQIANPTEFIQRVTDLYAHPDQSSFDTFGLIDKRVIERYSHPHIINDKVVGRVWSFRDVTARVADRDELKASQTKLQALFDLSPLGLTRNGMDGIFFEVNTAFTRMLGYKIEELNSMSYWDITPQEYADQEAIQIDNLRTKGSYGPYEKEYIHKDGHRFPVRLNGILIQDANGESYIWSIIEDITNQKIHESHLTEAIKAAEDASRSKGQFLANMSHEIRTPMNAIMGMINLLQSTELTDRQRDYASKTEGAAESLLGLLNDILDFSKVEAGKMTFENEPFRIDKLMRNLSVVLSANVGAKNIEVLFDIDPRLPANVRGDAMRLQQILVNLGGNAIKFTSTGQVVLAIRKLAESENSVTIEFSVQDTGIGIAPEHQEHIFSGFSQAEGSTTRRFGGTGLGLAISRRFVQLMGSDIQIISTPGVGSTFSFALEMPTVGAAEEAQTERTRPATVPQRVLVVDDNPIAGELTQRMVRQWGWEADLAMSGAQAIELISAHSATDSVEFPYPVIYMDWQMPDMDGWETTRQVRAQAQRDNLPQPIVIMVTAHGRELLFQRTQDEQSSINGFLVKPATASMVYDAWMDAQAGISGIRKLTIGRSSNRQLQGMRILVVEDNLINQQVAEELLAAEGATVSLAANGQLGVDAVAAAAPQFDVVLMDVQMPVLDGYGATQAIREDLGLKDLQIIAMTANAMASDRDACLAAGMNEHIGKPFDMAKLVSLLIRTTGINADLTQTAPKGDLQVRTVVMPEVAGLDIQTALNRMSGVRSLYLRTAKDFLKILDTAIPELQLCLKTGDKQPAMMKLHTLKGNAGTLGATELAKEAATLEKLCKTDVGIKECEAGLAQFEVMVRFTQDKMREAIARIGAEPEVTKPDSGAVKTGVISEAAIGALQTILALAKTCDMEVLQAYAQAHELIAEFPLEFVDALDMALQGLDLETATALSEQMLLQQNGGK
jgi:PAS domain S-box-containing protein